MKFIIVPLKFLVKLPIYFYKYIISPLLPHTCRFTPSCSNFFIGAVNEFGPFKGSILGVKRLARCTPRNRHYGYDPVPINIKGDSRWLF